MSTETFWSTGHKITRHNIDGSLTMGYRRFRAYFGTSPSVCSSAWNMLADVRPDNSKPEHLLWALLSLKQYCIESVNSTLIGVTEKTFRKWSLLFIKLLSDIPVVKLLFPNFINKISNVYFF